MNKYTIVSLLALLIVVAALPVYALYESGRMDGAQVALSERYVAEGADMYVENCASCHGSDGLGIGAMPSLNNPNLAKADRGVLYDTIAHSPHGTAMSAWHVDEGGALNSFQVEGLVTLIMSADWTEVSRLATVKGFREPALADPRAELATMEAGGEDGPARMPGLPRRAGGARGAIWHQLLALPHAGGVETGAAAAAHLCPGARRKGTGGVPDVPHHDLL